VIFKRPDKTLNKHRRVLFDDRRANEIKHDCFNLHFRLLKTQVPDFHLNADTGYPFVTILIFLFSEFIENFKTTAYLYAVKLSLWLNPVV